MSASIRSTFLFLLTFFLQMWYCFVCWAKYEHGSPVNKKERVYGRLEKYAGTTCVDDTGR
jgi:hypothetical protein